MHPLTIAIQLVFLFCLGLAPVISFAQVIDPIKIEQLLQQKERPTMSQFLDAFGGQLPDQNPFQATENLSERTWNEGPRIVAVLEYAFPGGIYASIGRDAVNITDLLEAFYLSLGQQGRTQRIDLSGASFPLNANSFLRYLEQKGLNLNPRQAVDQPFVIFDRTTFEYTSQSTEIYDIVSRYFASQGGSMADLLKRFNMATTFFKQSDDARDIDQQLQKQKDKGSLSSSNHHFLGINTKYTDLTAWHGAFQPLQHHGDQVFASPGSLASLENRQRVLHDLFEIAKVAQSPEFANKVDEYAKNHGMGENFYSRIQTRAIRSQQPAIGNFCRMLYR